MVTKVLYKLEHTSGPLGASFVSSSSATVESKSITLLIEGETNNSKSERIIQYTLRMDPYELASMNYGTHLKKTFSVDQYPAKVIEYLIFCHRDFKDEKSYSLTIDAAKNKVETNDGGESDEIKADKTGTNNSKSE